MIQEGRNREDNREDKICGQHASRAVFEIRPGDIARVFVSDKATHSFGDLLKYCAENHMPYRVVGAEELERVSGARHHEGICVIAKAKEAVELEAILAKPGAALILVLDGVSNPHNIGTLLRTAAHFGVRAVLLGGSVQKLSAAAFRTAEGAAEHVDVLFAEDLSNMLSRCKTLGYSICATSSHKGRNLYEAPMPEKLCLLLGAERAGLSKQLDALADQHLQIPGTSAVESLNVSSSSAVFLAEHWRSFRART